ncbi:MAG: hypothetical protein WCF71_18125 [Verrucomicrobiia bacterium]
MNENSPFRIGTFGRFIIFSGVGMAFIALFMNLLKPLDHIVGGNALFYVIIGVVIVNVVLVMIAYDRCPKRLTIPIGIAGWLLAFLFMFLWNLYAFG